MSEMPPGPPVPGGPGPVGGYPPGPPMVMPAMPPGGGGMGRSGWLWAMGLVFGLLGLFLFAAVLLTLLGSSDSGLSLGKKIAVIKLEGVILDPEDVGKQIVRYRDKDDIKAVVLRIDSPGGSVGPSQELYAEIGKLREVKPVVVSMGGVAASGGYYVACPASRILANPGTVTGSIGVIMQVVNLEGLMSWIRVDREVIKSGKFKDTGSPYRQMTKEERKYLDEFVQDVHSQFVTAVSESRELPLEQVRQLADGRIYSGAQALELGLVDQLGNLWDAIDVAAELGGIEGEPKVEWPKEPRRQLFWPAMQNLLGAMAEGFSGQPLQVMYMLPDYFN